MKYQIEWKVLLDMQEYVKHVVYIGTSWSWGIQSTWWHVSHIRGHYSTHQTNLALAS